MTPERAELIRSVYRKFDNLMVDLLNAAKKQGEKTPCCAGCFSCCYEPLMVSRQEAELLADRVLAAPAEERERVLAALRAWVAGVKAGKVLEHEEPRAVDYRRMFLACPLLKDGVCTVYNDRPIGCRGHYARRDRAKCDDLELRPHQEFLLPDRQVVQALSLMLEKEDMILDHLGVFLAELLLGEKLESESRRGMVVEDRS